jgi:hypothetical protein
LVPLLLERPQPQRGPDLGDSGWRQAPAPMSLAVPARIALAALIDTSAGSGYDKPTR